MNDKTWEILSQKDEQIAKLEYHILLSEVVSDIERLERAEQGKQPIKRSRTNDRTAMLKAARLNAKFPNDPRSVFAALRALAETNPQAPLFGYDVDAKALKWDNGPDVPPKYQSEKDALAAIKRYIEKSR